MPATAIQRRLQSKGGGRSPVGNKTPAQTTPQFTGRPVGGLTPLQPENSVPGPVDQTGLRFNPVYADVFRNLDRQLVGSQAGAQSQLNQLSEQRDRGVYDTEQMAQAARRALTQRMADQGILRSGVHVGARSDLNSDVISAIDSLNQQYNQGVTGVNTNLAQYMADLDSQREALRLAQARDEIETRLQEESRRASAASQLAYVQEIMNFLQGRQLGNQPNPYPTGRASRTLPPRSDPRMK